MTWYHVPTNGTRFIVQFLFKTRLVPLSLCVQAEWECQKRRKLQLQVHKPAHVVNSTGKVSRYSPYKIKLKTRKSSCVSARGIPPAAVLFRLAIPPCPDLGWGGGYPHPVLAIGAGGGGTPILYRCGATLIQSQWGGEGTHIQSWLGGGKVPPSSPNQGVAPFSQIGYPHWRDGGTSLSARWGYLPLGRWGYPPPVSHIGVPPPPEMLTDRYLWKQYLSPFLR